MQTSNAYENMIYGDARVPTAAQDESGQVKQLKAAGCGKIFREKITSATADRSQLRRLLSEIAAGDVAMVTRRLDRLARPTRDLVEHARGDHEKKAGFRSLGDAWADTTTSHGRLMLTVLGGLAEFERSVPAPAKAGRGRRRTANTLRSGSPRTTRKKRSSAGI